MKTAKLIILFSIFLNTSGYAEDCKYMIISDLDDTIKVTNSSGPKRETLYQALFTEQIYVGMDILLEAMSDCTPELGQETNLNIVSASPSLIEDNVLSFLEKFNLSVESVHLKDILQQSLTYRYKFNTITTLLAKTSLPVILIGDDTSYDAAVYNHIKAIYPKRIKRTYIHKISNQSKTYNEQITHNTAAEIAINEFLEGNIEENILQRVLESSLDLNEDNILLASFLEECPYFWSKCSKLSGKTLHTCRNLRYKIETTCYQREQSKIFRVED